MAYAMISSGTGFGVCPITSNQPCSGAPDIAPTQLCGRIQPSEPASQPGIFPLNGHDSDIATYTTATTSTGSASCSIARLSSSQPPLIFTRATRYEIATPMMTQITIAADAYIRLLRMEWIVSWCESALV